MTVNGRHALYACLACLAVGLIVGRCWQSKATDSRLAKLETRIAAYQADSVAFAAQDNRRTDTVIAVRHIVAVDSARAESLSRQIATSAEALSQRLAADSENGAMFDAFARNVQRRDSTRLAQIANLGRIVAVQDTQLVALHGRLTESNVMLAQAMAVARQLAARADRKWHLVVFGGYGAMLPIPSGAVSTGPQVGVGLAYSLF